MSRGGIPTWSRRNVMGWGERANLREKAAKVRKQEI